MAARCPPLSGGVRKYAEAPRQGGEGRQGERQGIARPGWLAAIPSPPGRGEEDGDEAGRMADRRGAALLFAGRSVARWWRGVAMASPRTRRSGRPSLTLGDVASGRGGERWRWCGRLGQQMEQRRGEELAKRSAASFALFLSFLLPFLFCLSLYSSLLFLFLFFLYI